MKRVLRFIASTFHYAILKNGPDDAYEFCNRSYSQYGEDTIIKNLLATYGLTNITYVDIGANHPFKFNNTALLYKNGAHGINIEPDLLMYAELKKYRQRDTNLNIGIHSQVQEIVYYQFEDSVFNTFSKEEADTMSQKGNKITGQTVLTVDTYNNIINQYLKGLPPTVLFLDAEGLDEIIIDSIDFIKFAPAFICVETYAYGLGVKNNVLINKIKNFGYSIAADTYVNTIFIKSNLYQQ